MLKELILNNLVDFRNSFGTWEDALRASCSKLIENEIVTAAYTDAIIESVHKFGPYIVILPGIAMPHAKIDVQGGVSRCAISFMKVEQAVSFEAGNPEKDANLFFTLAANNQDEHFYNMKKLSSLLMNSQLMEELMEVKSIEALQVIADRYDL